MTLLMGSAPGQTAAILGAVTLTTLLLAWRLGRTPERILACVLFAAFAPGLLQPLLVTSQSGTTAFRPDLAVRDSLILVSVGTVALRANRSYPLVMAGAALVATLAHLMRWLGLVQGGFSYNVLATAPACVMVAVFWMGLALHFRREKLIGPYPTWRDKPPPQAIAATGKIG